MKTTIFLAVSFLLIVTVLRLVAADVEVRDEAEFKKCVPSDAKVEKLAGGFKFVEGPTWVPSSSYLIFSDIPANELKIWTKEGGAATFRNISNNANGNTVDREGRLVTAEHGGRRISVTEKDGAIKTVVDQYNRKKLNSPNDVVVKSDGTIWFTDPDYGLKDKADKSGKEGKEQEGNYVYRFDPKSGTIIVLVKDFDKPNGLAFSPGERQLYVADSGKPKHIRVFDLTPNGRLNEGKVFCTIDKGGPDGIRCDSDGRVWSSAGDGVHIFARDGKLIGKILVAETPANLCFGGKDGKTLFITARTSLYAINVKVGGATR
jgi:gluconolactonase